MNNKILNETVLIKDLDGIPEEFNIGLAFYPSGKPKRVTVTKRTLLRNKREVKYLIYVLNKTGVNCRRLGLYFNLSKDTVKAWADEVDGWSEPDRLAVQRELSGGRRLPDKDCYDLPYQNREPEEALDYKSFDHEQTNF